MGAEAVAAHCSPAQTLQAKTERTVRTVTGPVMLREKSRQRPGVAGRAGRAHRSLGDLQDLVRGRTGGAQHRSRKSEGKDYKIVRREYIY